MYHKEYAEKKEIKDRITDYFQYLDKLRAQAEADGRNFFEADRYYYWKDKKEGHKLGYKQKQQ